MMKATVAILKYLNDVVDRPDGKNKYEKDDYYDRVGECFNWIDAETGEPWWKNHDTNPDYLFYKGDYFLYGERGYRKAVLADLIDSIKPSPSIIPPKTVGYIELTQEFNEGDIICEANNFKLGLNFFAKATDTDVEYSGKSKQYLKIVINKQI